MSAISFRCRRRQPSTSNSMVVGVNKNGSPLGYALGSMIDDDCLDSLMNLNDADIFDDFASAMEVTFMERSISPLPPLVNIPKHVSMESVPESANVESPHSATVNETPRTSTVSSSKATDTSIKKKEAVIARCAPVPVKSQISSAAPAASSNQNVPVSQKPPKVDQKKMAVVDPKPMIFPQATVCSPSNASPIMMNQPTNALLQAYLAAQNQQQTVSPVSVSSPMLWSHLGNTVTPSSSSNGLPCLQGGSNQSLDIPNQKLSLPMKRAAPQMVASMNTAPMMPNTSTRTMAAMMASLVSQQQQHQGWLQTSPGGIVVPPIAASNAPLTNPIYAAALAMKQKKAERKEIRRDRNRIHAKQSRQRKKSLTDELGHSLEDLKQENDLLKQRIRAVIYKDQNLGEEEFNKILQDRILMDTIARSTRPQERFVKAILSHKTLDDDTISFLQSMRKNIPSSTEDPPPHKKLKQDEEESQVERDSNTYQKSIQRTHLADVAVTIG